MNRPMTALTIAAAMAIVACSGSEAAPGSTLEPPSILTPQPSVDTTAVVDSTTAPEPATTAASTSTTTTEPAPTTTVDPVEEIRSTIEQRNLDLEAAFDASQGDPSNSALRDEYRGFYTPEAFEPRERFLDMMVLDGTTLRASDTMPKTITFPGKFELVDETTAIIRVCRVDTDVLRIAPQDGAPEIIVDDTVVASLTDSEFHLIDGSWVLAGGERISSTPGAVACAPAA